MPPRARQKTKTTPQTSPKREPQDQSTTHASEAGLLDPTPTQKTSLEPSQLFPSQTSLQFPESSIPSTQTNSDATPLLTSPNPPLNASQNTLMKAPSNPSMNASQNILMNASQNTLMNASQNILMNASQNTLVNASQNTLMNTSPYPLLNTNNQQSQQLDVTDTGKGTKFSKKWTTPGSECFKPFLKASNKGDFWFYCGACKTDYRTSYLYGTNSHFETKIHLDSERQWYIDHPEAMEEQANEASQKSMIFYFKLLEFIAKKNISLNLADDIIAFLKENPQGVAGLKNTKVSRKKSSLILNKAVRPLILDGIDEILSQKYWSLLIDECTDKSKKKYLAIFVQFWVKGTGIKCLLYRLINCSEALNSEEIYKLIDSAILSKPFAQNLIGFASDGAAVMRGSKNSVLQKMKMTHPKIFDVHCISHCFNLLGNYATEVLPEAIEFLVKQIFNHFAHSAFRVSRWLTLQEHMNLKPYKMLTYGQTRWCSLEAAISRILERWSALIEYFQIVKGEDAQVIVPLMEKEETKIYFEFLKLYLHKINELCLKFQKNVSEVCSIDTSITNFYSSCMNVLLKDEYRKIPFDQKLKLVAKVENSKTMTIEEKYMKTAQELDTHIKLIYGNVISLASVSQEDKRLDIVSHIQQFIMRLLYKAKKILPFDNKLLKQLPSIFPPTFNFDEAFSLVQNYDNIIPSEQSHLVWEDLQNFSDNISTLQKLFEKEKLDITSFYNHKIVRDNFQYFAEFATALLSLPLSTAEVERSFSQLKMVKTDRRNQLKDSTLEALMLNKYYQINFDDQIMRKKAAMRYHQISYDLKDSENDKKRARISEDQPETLSELEKERLKRKKKECLGSLMLAEFEDELIDIKFKKPGSITFKF